MFKFRAIIWDDKISKNNCRITRKAMRKAAKQFSGTIPLTIDFRVDKKIQS